MSHLALAWTCIIVSAVLLVLAILEVRRSQKDAKHLAKIATEYATLDAKYAGEMTPDEIEFYTHSRWS